MTAPMISEPPTATSPKAWITCAGVGLPQHQPGGGHVQAQPEQRRHQQQRREHREVERLLHEHGRQQDHQRQQDVDDDQHVEQRTPASARSAAARCRPPPRGRRACEVAVHAASSCSARTWLRVSTRPGMPRRRPRDFSDITKARTRATALYSSAGISCAELAGGVQRAGERDVLDHRHLLGLGLLADARGDRSGALGHHAGRGLSRLVLEGDGEVGRVDAARRRRRRRRRSSGCGSWPAAGSGAGDLISGSPSVFLFSSLTSFLVIRVFLRLRLMTTKTSATASTRPAATAELDERGRPRRRRSPSSAETGSPPAASAPGPAPGPPRRARGRRRRSSAAPSPLPERLRAEDALDARSPG